MRGSGAGCNSPFGLCMATIRSSDLLWGPMRFQWVAIEGVVACGYRRAGLRRGSEVGRGTSLRRALPMNPR
jgi:hypothetical protein